MRSYKRREKVEARVGHQPASVRLHLAATTGAFVFTTRRDCPLRRSTVDRRVFRPAVDGDARKGIHPVRPRA